MTRDAKIREKLSVWQPSGRQQFRFPVGSDWTVTIAAENRDELSCLLWQLSVARTGDAPARETMKIWADRLATNVTGLLEPLKVVELDDQRGEGFLRSVEPSEREAQLCYFELFLEGTKTAHLRRYQSAADKSSKREQTTFALTYESLGKLIDDLTR